MRQKSVQSDSSSERLVIFGRGEDSCRARWLRGEHSITELCRRERIAGSFYYRWSKEFLEAGKRRLASDTARAATSDEVRDLRGRRRH
jgi:hypothetical protein